MLGWADNSHLKTIVNNEKCINERCAPGSFSCYCRFDVGGHGGSRLLRESLDYMNVNEQMICGKR